MPGAFDSKELNLSPHEIKVILDTINPRLASAIVLPESDFMMERREREARLAEVCELIFGNLRLDIYGNLTIGGIAFLRKVHTLQERAAHAIWFRDAKAWRTSGKGTEVYRGMLRFGPRCLLVVIYENWGDLLWECYDPLTADFYVHRMTLRYLILHLRHPTSTEALRAFLACVRTARYTDAVVRMLAQRLDLRLPGEDGRWYRHRLEGEVPVFHLRPHGDKAYFATSYTTRRYLSRLATNITFTESLKGFLRIRISKGTFGPAAFHYGGNPIEEEMDMPTLRKFLTLSQCPDPDILHPARRPQLYDHLLDRMEIITKRERRKVEEELPADMSPELAKLAKLLGLGKNKQAAPTPAPSAAAKEEQQRLETAATTFITLHRFARWAAKYKVRAG
jgi:hypothetical protein